MAEVFSRAINTPSPTQERWNYPSSSDKYEILNCIGRGQNSEVFEAILKTTVGDHVAVKKFDLEKINDIDKIRREVSISSQNLHPNIASFHASFVSGHHLCLVMDLLEGSCLDLLKWTCPTGLKDEELVVGILKQVLQGLEYIHKNGLMHRNVKAGKILVDKQGNVMLADFAIAADSICGDRRSARHSFVGSPCWMAPEVLEQASGYDSRADIWSVGITALELINGRPPYWQMFRKSPLGVLVKVLEGSPPIDIPSHFSKNFREFVEACLQKDNKQRPSASKLLEMKLFKSVKKPDQPVKEFIAHLPPRAERIVIPDPQEEEERHLPQSPSAFLLTPSRSTGRRSSSPTSPVSMANDLTATSINTIATSTPSNSTTQSFIMQTAIQQQPHTFVSSTTTTNFDANKIGDEKGGSSVSFGSFGGGERSPVMRSVESSAENQPPALSDFNLRRLEAMPLGGKSIRWDFGDENESEQRQQQQAEGEGKESGPISATLDLQSATMLEEEPLDFSSSSDDELDDVNDRTVRIPGYSSMSSRESSSASLHGRRDSFQSDRRPSPPLITIETAGRFAPIQGSVAATGVGVGSTGYESSSMTESSRGASQESSSFDDPINVPPPPQLYQAIAPFPLQHSPHVPHNLASSLTEEQSSESGVGQSDTDGGSEHDPYFSTESHDEHSEEIHRLTYHRSSSSLQLPPTALSTSGSTSQNSTPPYSPRTVGNNATVGSGASSMMTMVTSVSSPQLSSVKTSPRLSSQIVASGTPPLTTALLTATATTTSPSSSTPGTPRDSKKVEKLGRFLLKTVEGDQQSRDTQPLAPLSTSVDTITSVCTSATSPPAFSFPENPSAAIEPVTTTTTTTSTTQPLIIQLQPPPSTLLSRPQPQTSTSTPNNTVTFTATTTPDQQPLPLPPTANNAPPFVSLSISTAANSANTCGSSGVESSVTSPTGSTTSSFSQPSPTTTPSMSRRRSRNFQVSVVSENEMASRLAGRKPSSKEGQSFAIVQVDSSGSLASPPSSAGSSTSGSLGGSHNVVSLVAVPTKTRAITASGHHIHQQLHALIQQSQAQSALLQQLLSSTVASESETEVPHSNTQETQTAGATNEPIATSTTMQTAESSLSSQQQRPLNPLSIVKELEAQLARLIQENEKLRVENEGLKRQLSRTPPPPPQQPSQASARSPGPPAAVAPPKQSPVAPPIASQGTPPPRAVSSSTGVASAIGQTPVAVTKTVVSSTTTAMQPSTSSIVRPASAAPATSGISSSTSMHKLDLLARQQMEQLTQNVSGQGQPTLQQ